MVLVNSTIMDSNQTILIPTPDSSPHIHNTNMTMNESMGRHIGNPSGQEQTTPATQVESLIYLYITPFFIVIGTLGNIISCLALRKPPLNTFSPSIYLMSFAISAILILSIVVGVEWCLDVAGVHYMFSPAVCRILEFLKRMVTYSGQWFIVGSAIDRFVVLWFPNKSNDICTVFMAKSGVVIILTAMIAISIHALWMAGFEESRNMCYIYGTQEHNPFVWLWLWVSGLIYGIIPQMILFFFGNLLSIRLCLKHRGRQLPDTAALDIDLTYTTMAISLLFFLNVPATILNIILKMPSFKYDQHAKEIHTIYTIFNYVSWITYSGLFFILFACSKAFRETVRGMFVNCIMIFNRNSSTVEMKLMPDDYDQVPSTSTTL